MTKSIMNSKRREVKEMRHAFAQSVIAMRRECGKTAEQLAEECGLPLEAIYNLELGNFERWGDILRIARYYRKKVKVVFY